jgi:beta-lactamase class A
VNQLFLKSLHAFLLSVLLTVWLAVPVMAAPLASEIGSDIRGFNGKVGVYAKNLKTRKSYSFQADTIFPTASTSKLVVALSVYKYLYPRSAAGDKEDYDDAISRMMVVSDNNAFYELLEDIKDKRPDALVKVTRDLRLKKTKIHNEEAFRKFNYHSVTTPYEMAKVMESINTEKYLGREKSSMMKDELANTIFHDEIPRFMLTKVMHKVGELDNILTDVGIVDDGKDQILISIFTDTAESSAYASDFIAHTSAKLYNLLRRK